MSDFLNKIVKRKENEVALLKKSLCTTDAHNEIRSTLAKILEGEEFEKAHPRRFENALRRQNADGLAVIAEIKRSSPSAGKIGDIPNPDALAKKYEKGGASAISCLTDSHFDGTLDDLKLVTGSVALPVMRKDFLVDAVQIAEAKIAGASAVLLMVNVLGDRLSEMLKYCEVAGMCALVEVHSEAELKVAEEADARIIGVNARDMKTFNVDLATNERIIPLIKPGILIVAESGIKTPADAHRMKKAGAHAVLVGEALVRSTSPQHFIAEARAA
eukprot:Selendium_serpulae@DN5791_c0_g1_i2.p1